MTPGKERLYWGAVNALREAESLAQLAGVVGGPADEPPRAGEEESWVTDWSNRAREALGRARDWVSSKKRALRDRAARIAHHVQEGARRIYQASPLPATRRALESVTDAARAITIASMFAGIGTTVLLVLGALWLLPKALGAANEAKRYYVKG